MSLENNKLISYFEMLLEKKLGDLRTELLTKNKSLKEELAKTLEEELAKSSKSKAKVTKVKKGGPKKPSDYPKANKNAFIHFQQDNREKYKKKLEAEKGGPVTNAEISRHLGVVWNKELNKSTWQWLKGKTPSNADVGNKEKGKWVKPSPDSGVKLDPLVDYYNKKADEDKKRYLAELEKYKLTDSYKNYMDKKEEFDKQKKREALSEQIQSSVASQSASDVKQESTSTLITNLPMSTPLTASTTVKKTPTDEKKQKVLSHIFGDS